MTISTSCPVCEASAAWEPFIAFPATPRTGIFPALPPAVVEKHDLLFEHCPICGLIRRRIPDTLEPDYAEVDRATAGQLPVYLADLEEEIAGLFPDKRTALVDVGGNDGSFLLRFIRRGYENCLNIEPSRALAQKSMETGCKALSAPLTLEQAEFVIKTYGKADVVFLRHVLEHVVDPVAMLHAVHELLHENGMFYLELPDSRGIIEDTLAHELWEEHLFYYSPSAAGRLLEKTGFSLRSQATFPHRGGYNTLMQARKRAPGDACRDVPDTAPPAGIASFSERWSRYCSALHQAALTWPRPVYMVGASHPQTNFIHFSGLDHLVTCAVDDDPTKIGRFLHMTPPVPIVSSSRFKEIAGGGTLLLTAWGCDAWTKDLSEAAHTMGMCVVEPYRVGI